MLLRWQRSTTNSGHIRIPSPSTGIRRITTGANALRLRPAGTVFTRASIRTPSGLGLSNRLGSLHHSSNTPCSTFPAESCLVHSRSFFTCSAIYSSHGKRSWNASKQGSNVNSAHRSKKGTTNTSRRSQPHPHQLLHYTPYSDLDPSSFSMDPSDSSSRFLTSTPPPSSMVTSLSHSTFSSNRPPPPHLASSSTPGYMDGSTSRGFALTPVRRNYINLRLRGVSLLLAARRAAEAYHRLVIVASRLRTDSDSGMSRNDVMAMYGHLYRIALAGFVRHGHGKESAMLVKRMEWKKIAFPRHLAARAALLHARERFWAGNGKGDENEDEDGVLSLDPDMDLDLQQRFQQFPCPEGNNSERLDGHRHDRTKFNEDLNFDAATSLGPAIKPNTQVIRSPDSRADSPPTPRPTSVLAAQQRALTWHTAHADFSDNDAQIVVYDLAHVHGWSVSAIADALLAYMDSHTLQGRDGVSARAHVLHEQVSTPPRVPEHGPTSDNDISTRQRKLEAGLGTKTGGTKIPTSNPSLASGADCRVALTSWLGDLWSLYNLGLGRTPSFQSRLHEILADKYPLWAIQYGSSSKPNEGQDANAVNQTTQAASHAGPHRSPRTPRSIIDLPLPRFSGAKHILSWLAAHKLPANSATFSRIIKMLVARHRYDQALALYQVLQVHAKTEPAILPTHEAYIAIFTILRRWHRFSCMPLESRNAFLRAGPVRFPPAERIPSTRAVYADMIRAHARLTGGKTSNVSHAVRVGSIQMGLERFLRERDYAGAYVALRTFRTCRILPTLDTYKLVTFSLMDRIARELQALQGPKPQTTAQSRTAEGVSSSSMNPEEPHPNTDNAASGSEPQSSSAWLDFFLAPLQRELALFSDRPRDLLLAYLVLRLGQNAKQLEIAQGNAGRAEYLATQVDARIAAGLPTYPRPKPPNPPMEPERMSRWMTKHGFRPSPMMLAGMEPLPYVALWDMVSLERMLLRALSADLAVELQNLRDAHRAARRARMAGEPPSELAHIPMVTFKLLGVSRRKRRKAKFMLGPLAKPRRKHGLLSTTRFGNSDSSSRAKFKALFFKRAAPLLSSKMVEKIRRSMDAAHAKVKARQEREHASALQQSDAEVEEEEEDSLESGLFETDFSAELEGFSDMDNPEHDWSTLYPDLPKEPHSPRLRRTPEARAASAEAQRQFAFNRKVLMLRSVIIRKTKEEMIPLISEEEWINPPGETDERKYRGPTYHQIEL